MTRGNKIALGIMALAAAAVYSLQFWAMDRLSLYLIPQLAKAVTGALSAFGIDSSVMTWHLGKVGAGITSCSAVVSTARYAITIAAECCGVRSFCTLVGASLLYAMFHLGKPGDRARFIASAAAVAVLFNFVRVFGVFVFAWHCGMSAGMVFHDLSGYAVFLIEVAILLRLETELKRKPKPRLVSDPRSGFVRRALLVNMAGLAALTALGTDKGVASATRLFNLVLAMNDGTLRGGEKVVSAAQAAALEEFNAQTDSIISASTQIVAQAESEFIWLEAAATNFPERVYLTCDLPYDNAAATSSANIEMRAERHEVGIQDGRLILRVFVTSNAEPLSAPVIPYELELLDYGTATLEPITNTFPVLFQVETLNGLRDAYRYDYALPAEAAGVALIPTYALPFGGYNTNEFFNINGTDAGLLISTNGTSWAAGRTGWVRVPGMPFELELLGGTVVGYREVSP